MSFERFTFDFWPLTKKGTLHFTYIKINRVKRSSTNYTHGIRNLENCCYCSGSCCRYSNCDCNNILLQEKEHFYAKLQAGIEKNQWLNQAEHSCSRNWKGGLGSTGWSMQIFEKLFTHIFWKPTTRETEPSIRTLNLKCSLN